MEVKVSHVDGVRFAIQARSHVVSCDQPLEKGGEDSGMTPPEFLLASLGSCAAYYAAEYLRTRNLAQTGVEVSVTAKKLLKPARLGNFRIHVLSPVQLTPEHNEATDPRHRAMPRAQHAPLAAGNQNRSDDHRRRALILPAAVAEPHTEAAANRRVVDCIYVRIVRRSSSLPACSSRYRALPAGISFCGRSQDRDVRA